MERLSKPFPWSCSAQLASASFTPPSSSFEGALPLNRGPFCARFTLFLGCRGSKTNIFVRAAVKRTRRNAAAAAAKATMASTMAPISMLASHRVMSGANNATMRVGSLSPELRCTTISIVTTIANATCPGSRRFSAAAGISTIRRCKRRAIGVRAEWIRVAQQRRNTIAAVVIRLPPGSPSAAYRTYYPPSNTTASLEAASFLAKAARLPVGYAGRQSRKRNVSF